MKIDSYASYSVQTIDTESHSRDKQTTQTDNKQKTSYITVSEKDIDLTKLEDKLYKRMAARQTGQTEEQKPEEAPDANKTGEKPDSNPKAAKEQDPATDAEIQARIRELQAIDNKVRSHEMAHKAAAGQYGGAMSFSYTKGPDGRQYAIAGEVAIDTSKASTPEATIQKMETVRSAALAPADPSPQDQKVAAAATMKASEARMELVAQKQEETAAKSKAPQQTEGSGKSTTKTTNKADFYA